MIKRGAICVNNQEELFIVTSVRYPASPFDTTAMWAGTVLADGTPTLCIEPKFIAGTFQEWAAEHALEVGVTAAEKVLEERRGELIWSP